jgi:hypothetical protein
MLFCLSLNSRSNMQYYSVQFFGTFFNFQKGVEKKRTEFLYRVCVISTQNWFISLDAWVLNWVVMLFWKCAKVQRLFSKHNVTNIFQLEHLLVHTDVFSAITVWFRVAIFGIHK